VPAKAGARALRGPGPLLTRKRVWLVVTVSLVLGGVAGSLLGARAIARSDANKARLAFRTASVEVAASVKLAIQHEEDLVVNARAFIRSDPNASAAEFDRWAESVEAMKRYPELQNIGLVKLVAASQLASFRRRLAANPVRPFGPRSTGVTGSLEILPPGSRAYYCLAVAGLARSLATYLPAGVDYCALAPQLILDRDRGIAGYAPFVNGSTVSLGIETPVYSGGPVPGTLSARKRTFLGWLGELLVPNVVLESALSGHPNLVARFRYDSRFSHVQFSRGGAIPRGAQSATIPLLVGREALGNSHEGWTLQSFAAPVASGTLHDRSSLTLLVGGSLLSLVLGLLVFVLASGRTRALSLVSEKTRELDTKNRELAHQAAHDALTGLPNRTLVLERAAQLLARAAREPNAMTGALFIDIDGFKHVNDNLGHAAGDQLLRIVAQRLRAAVREQDTVGRLGGDEFVVLAESNCDAALDPLAERVADALREPVEFEDKTIAVTASIGVAVGRYPDPDALLRDADLALYAAKAAGKDRYTLFDAGMSRSTDARARLERELSAAVQEDQFFLLYQPLFDLRQRAAVGVEALIRWQHPAKGVVPPNEFIPLAEESGLIGSIGRRVLDEACRQAAAWAERGLEMGMSVNVSAFQVGRKGFVETVRRSLRDSGLDPSSLTLEITETALMGDLPAACEQLEAVRALGVRVAIDDFGTGYASLSNLQRVPVDILKIDMSFVAALNDGAQSRELLQAILHVGEALSLAVVAEGIEDESQMQALLAMGFETGQGFLMAKPSSAKAIEARFGSGSIPLGVVRSGARA